MVEHRLAKARVASSNLVSRSNPPSGASSGWLRRIGAIRITDQLALPRRGTQVVRERSAKPLCVGSIPARASNTSQQLTTIEPEAASSGCRYGCQLANQPSSVACLRRLRRPNFAAQLSTQRLCRHVRRLVEDMSVELEKNVGPRVSKAFLRRLDGHMSSTICVAPQCRRRRQVICGRPSSLRPAECAAPEESSCQIGPVQSCPFKVVWKHPVVILSPSSEPSSASRRSTSASVSRIGRLERWYFGV